MKKIKQKLAKALTEALSVEIKPEDFSVPPNPDLGDLALPCFDLAKRWSKNPAEAAKEVAARLGKRGFLAKTEPAGPYVNFIFKAGFVAKNILTGALKLKAKKKTKVMIEYSQPNTHKEFHIGHLRNACLGAAMVNIYRALGHNVVAANYIGDTGAHVAKCLWNLQQFHANEALPENKGEYLGKIYAEAVSRLEADEKLMAEVSIVQKKLERGDAALIKLWQETKEWSLQSFNKIYDLLNNRFDVWFWESEEEKQGRRMIKKILRDNSLKEIRRSEGAVIADLTQYGLDVLVLIKSDGNVLYGAKDLPLGIKKFKKYKIQKSIYIVDKRQSLYLKQIFKLLDLLGYADREKVHISHEFVTLPEGAMASRKGNVVTFENFYAEVLARTIAETVKRHADWPEAKTKSIAEKIALAAIKFFMLKYDNDSVIVFDADKALSFDGSTGPYLLYIVARIKSILRKVKDQGLNNQGGGKLKIQPAKIEKPEKRLMWQIGLFEEAVEKSAEGFCPAEITKYLLELAQIFNNFYHDCPVLQAASDIRDFRIKLILQVENIMEKGLALLGIETADEM